MMDANEAQAACVGRAGATAELVKLHRTLLDQMANHAALASLAGRLDVLCAQIPAASGVQDIVYQPQVSLAAISIMAAPRGWHQRWHEHHMSNPWGLRVMSSLLRAFGNHCIATNGS